MDQRPVGYGCVDSLESATVRTTKSGGKDPQFKKLGTDPFPLSKDGSKQYLIERGDGSFKPIVLPLFTASALLF